MRRLVWIPVYRSPSYPHPVPIPVPAPSTATPATKSRCGGRYDGYPSYYGGYGGYPWYYGSYTEQRYPYV